MIRVLSREQDGGGVLRDRWLRYEETLQAARTTGVRRRASPPK
jgi:hypothetical protein